jgi:hypothetical protein
MGRMVANSCGSSCITSSMLLLVAVTPHAVAYAPAAAPVRPRAAAAAGHVGARAAVLAQSTRSKRAPALRSTFPGPGPLANAQWILQARAGQRPELTRGLRMAISDKAEPPANVDVPEQLPLKVVSNNGRIVTAKLELDMTGTWLLQGRRVEFDGGAGSGTVLWQRIPLIFILRDDANAASFSSAIIQPSNATIPVSEHMFGKELDAMGRVLDNPEAKPAADDDGKERSLFGIATQLADMATISRPMHTGITAVDALTPIGKGQNMLIVGSDALGRRQLALDAAVTQATEGNLVVYVDVDGNKADILPRLQAS